MTDKTPQQAFTDLIVVSKSFEIYKDILFEIIHNMSNDEFETLVENWSGKRVINETSEYFVLELSEDIFGDYIVYFQIHAHKMSLNTSFFSELMSATCKPEDKKDKMALLAALLSTPEIVH